MYFNAFFANDAANSQIERWRGRKKDKSEFWEGIRGNRNRVLPLLSLSFSEEIDFQESINVYFSCKYSSAGSVQ
jgi:hypothetical protein